MKINAQLIKSRKFLNVLVGIFSVAFGIHFILIANGDVINSYPLITPDGFDWYTEGIYFTKLLSGATGLPTLPILRPPGFVMVTALDYLLGGRGIVLALVFSATIFGTYYYVGKIIDFRYENEDSRWYTIPLVLAVTIYPINYIRIYLLSDPICVFISLAAAYFFIKYMRDDRKGNLIFSAFLFLIAGLTQTYGLIPMIVIYGLVFFKFFNQDRKKSVAVFLSGLTTISLFALVTYEWRNLIPHINTPQNFDLLELNLKMFGFYTAVWGYYLIPFLLYFLVSRNAYLRKMSFDNIVAPASVLIVIIFLVFSFFYQWQEARFTYYLWAWLLIAVFVNVDLKTVSNGAILKISFIMIFACVVTPDDYWSPTSSTLKIAPKRNWLVVYFRSRTTDRQLRECRATCENNAFLAQSDSYVNSVVSIYNQLK